MFAKMTDQQITVDSWQNIKEKTLNINIKIKRKNNPVAEVNRKNDNKKNGNKGKC